MLIAAPALAVAACSGPPTPPTTSSAPSTTGATSPSGGFTDRMTNALFGQPAKQGQGKAEADNPDCPTIDVRQGASTLTVYGQGEQTATNVRYQATVGQTARECALLGATMTMKVGMQGRIIMGPLGGPGRLDVPVRFALVQEGPEPKTIWTKFYSVGVQAPAGQPNVAFTHVEDNMTFPKPSAADLEAYVIYVGFDKTGVREQSRPRGRRARTSAR